MVDYKGKENIIDPNAVYKTICQSKDIEEIEDAIGSLIAWIESGGFLPNRLVTQGTILTFKLKDRQDWINYLSGMIEGIAIARDVKNTL